VSPLTFGRTNPRGAVRRSPGTSGSRNGSRQSSLLGQLDADDARHFDAVLSRCPRLRLEAGTRLPPDELARASLLVVEDGVAAIVAEPAPGTRPMTLALSRAGDLLVPPREGERLAALTEARLTLLTPLVCRALLSRPAAAAVLVDRLVEAVRDRQESLAQFGAVEHVRRVREKLLQLARTHGRVASDGVHLDLPLTHELIARMTGSARETVTAAISELTREGFLVREGRRYRLTVPPELLDLRLAAGA
jgi:CRP-like cAMP-binding protein